VGSSAVVAPESEELSLSEARLVGRTSRKITGTLAGIFTKIIPFMEF
jgi:hypothetical protein